MAGRVPLLVLTVVLLVLPADADFITYDALKGHPYTVSYDERAFTINGTRTLLLGGSFHPPRIAFGDWETLLTEAKADGLNHVQVYVFWCVYSLDTAGSNFGLARCPSDHQYVTVVWRLSRCTGWNQEFSRAVAW